MNNPVAPERALRAGRTAPVPWLAFFGASLPALLLYLRTLSPTVLLGDMGEFQFTGYILGVPHPTGYPLYTLLSKLFTLLPFGDVAYRVNLSSAVYMAAAAGVTATIVSVLLTRSPQEHQSQPSTYDRRGPVAALWGVACGWLFAVSGTAWDQAVLARSYALNALLVSLILLVLLLWWIERRTRWFLLFWLLLGLSFAHHGTTITLLPGYLAFVAYCVLRIAYLSRSGRSTADTAAGAHAGTTQNPLIHVSRNTQYAIRNTFCAIAAFALGLSPYLLFAYRFVFGYTYYWGNPRSWADVWSLMRGTPFQSQVLAYPLTWESQAERAAFGLGQLADQFGWLGAAGALLGLLLLLGSRLRPAGMLLLLVWLGNFFFAVNYGIIGHIYLIPGYLVCAICLGMAALPLLGRADARARVPRLLLAGLAGLLLVALAAWLAVERLPAHDQSGNTLVAELAGVTLREAEPGAVIYVDWESISVLRYYQYAEGRRPDLRLESGNPDGWHEAIAAELDAGRPVYVGGFAGPDPPAPVREQFALERVGLVYRVLGRK